MAMMDPDQFTLAEKIVKDLYNVFERNNHLSSFEILSVSRNTRNKTPIVVTNDCLGLEMWCVKHVYTYCYLEIKEYFLNTPGNKLYRITSLDAECLIKLMNAILLLNPDLTLVWNQRRVLYLRDMLDKRKELRFTKLVLSRKTKCNDAFSYRRWLFEFDIEVEMYGHAMEILIAPELLICELTANTTANNYHSWNHRIWIINKLKEYNKEQILASLYVAEYAFTEKWQSKNISDFSGYHYRQFCLLNFLAMTTPDKWLLFERTFSYQQRLFIEFLDANMPKPIKFYVDKGKYYVGPDTDALELVFGEPLQNCTCQYKIPIMCKRMDMLVRELFLNNEAIRYYWGHETLWTHRRFIFHQLLLVFYDYFGVEWKNGSLSKVACKGCNADAPEESWIAKYDGTEMKKSKLFLSLINHEQRFLTKRKSFGDVVCAEKQQKYLNLVEGLKV